MPMKEGKSAIRWAPCWCLLPLTHLVGPAPLREPQLINKIEGEA